MISVQLKAKHFYYVVNDLKNFSASDFYSLIKRIAMQTTDVADDDLVSVNTSVADFVKIFSIVAGKPEGQANRINTDMMNILNPQITAGVAANDEEWISAAQQIEAIRNANWAISDNAISTGKTFVKES